MVSVLEVRIELGDFNPRPLTPQSVILPTLPRAGLGVDRNVSILFIYRSVPILFIYRSVSILFMYRSS